MWSQESVLAIVGEIYDAALEPQLWPAVLEKLATLLNSEATVLMAHDNPQVPVIRVTSAARMDDAYQREYNDYYAARNIWSIQGKRFARPGLISTSDMICTKQEFEKSEYYNDFARRLGIYHGMFANFAGDDIELSGFATTRQQRHGVFGPSEIQLFQVLLLHFRRALQLHARMLALEDQRKYATAALDRLPCGCILVGPAGKVLFVNSAAEMIIQARDGLGLARGSINAADAVESRKLHAMVVAATETGLRRGFEGGGTIAISRPSLKRPYSVLVIPITLPEVSTARKRVAAAVFITDHETAAPGLDRNLRELFGLTNAEIRLVRALLQGGGLRQAADSVGISVNTAKTHLQRIFHKTNTRRQSELVRLLMGGPSSLIP